ncbi:hypothetical protein C7399_118133 [Paraburkholderia tropica]|uniref:Secreted protein n=1 Tax=Paraburkholderia tropica TaxID=92647 RepID=A0ABX5MPE5_9BURK|nr:hypothetical protein C7400_117135 [Paraburkholderia tropica]PZW76508.1 hypothetical protein C7399_118133 [Paraburkholderia tropica]
MATTSLNIVQRIGGPTMTPLCATFLAWKLRSPSLAMQFQARMGGRFWFSAVFTHSHFSRRFNCHSPGRRVDP